MGEKGCYLICFSKPIGTKRHAARHYCGFAEDIDARFVDHIKGLARAARLTQVAVERGVEMKIVRRWPGADRRFERKLKDGSLTSLCPLCRPAATARATERQRERRRRKRLEIAGAAV